MMGCGGEAGNSDVDVVFEGETWCLMANMSNGGTRRNIKAVLTHRTKNRFWDLA